MSSKPPKRTATEARAVVRRTNDRPGEAWGIYQDAMLALARDQPEHAAACAREARNVFEEGGADDGIYSAYGIFSAVCLLGEAQYAQGRYADAVAAYGEAVSIQVRTGFVRDVEDLLEDLAIVAVALGANEQAAELFGAASTWRAIDADPRVPYGMADYRAATAASRRSLGPRRWQSAFDAGARLTSRQAMALADAAVDDLAARASASALGLTARERQVLSLIADGSHDAGGGRAAPAQPTYRAGSSAVGVHEAGRDDADRGRASCQGARSDQASDVTALPGRHGNTALASAILPMCVGSAGNDAAVMTATSTPQRPPRRTQQGNPRSGDEEALNAFLGQIVSDLGASAHICPDARRQHEPVQPCVRGAAVIAVKAWDSVLGAPPATHVGAGASSPSSRSRRQKDPPTGRRPSTAAPTGHLEAHTPGRVGDRGARQSMIKSLPTRF